uniref:Uncharacterized protein n=1 Tax=Fagus sylvatica TaxID=28930 RepID=A0A2N9IU47_FAGSY
MNQMKNDQVSFIGMLKRKMKMVSDKDKEIHNLSDCELENELRDFDDLPMYDLDGSNDMN